jgi:hypothetical protein
VTAPSARGTLRCERSEEDAHVLRYHQATGDVTRAVGPGGFAERVQAHLSLAENLSSGVAHVFRTRRFDDGGREVVEPRQDLLTWDDAHFDRATDGISGRSYRRSAPTEHALRYTLYRAAAPRAGARVEPAGGFGFVTQSGAYGWADAFGVQVDGALPAEGELVSRALPAAAGEDETYTVRRAPGRLFRCTRTDLPLAAARAHDFLWRVWEPGLGRAVLYRVRYEHDAMLGAEAWLRVAAFDEATGAFTPLAPAEPIDTAARGHLALWCDELGGLVSFLDGDAVIGIWAPEPVDGDDAAFGAGDELTLHGFVDALASEIDTLAAEAGDVWLPPAPDAGTPHRFVFDERALALLHDVDGSGTDLRAVGLATGAVPKSGLFTWGLRGGPLLDAATAATLAEPRDAWRAGTIYVWETGANPWNELFALVDDSGGFVDLPLPLRFVYVHARANDRNGDDTHAGETFVLRYHGPGDLRGIPLAPRDLDGDLAPDRSYPRFSLRDGALVGPGGDELLVRAVALEQTLVEEAGNPGGFSLVPASDLVVPNGAEHAPPTIGRDPTADAPPRVIDGVVVD